VATSAMAAIAFVTKTLDCMSPDTHSGYVKAQTQQLGAYSGVTYAAVRPPSTRNVVPFT
jgi:hypothetical protein